MKCRARYKISPLSGNDYECCYEDGHVGLHDSRIANHRERPDLHAARSEGNSYWVENSHQHYWAPPTEWPPAKPKRRSDAARVVFG